MTQESRIGYYVATLRVCGALPVLIVLAMTISREFDWTWELLPHFAFGAALGWVTARTELALLRPPSEDSFAKANRVAAGAFIMIMVGGTLVARRWFGSTALFTWMCGWGTLRFALLWRAVRDMASVPDG